MCPVSRASSCAWIAAFLAATTAVALGQETRDSHSQPSDVQSQFAQIEQRLGGRVGVQAISQDRQVAYRSDERFPMCSTFKVLAVAAVLNRVDEKKETFDRFVPYGEAQLLEHAPVTRAHVKEGGMKLGDLCAAAIEQSDNTAGNLLLEAIGGPAELTNFARSLGDQFTRLDRIEPELNDAIPGDERDTTTPAAMCGDLQRLLTSDFLSAASRERLENWMRHYETGAGMIRAGVSGDWQVSDKTGRSTKGATNDIALLRSPTGGPVFLTIFTFAPESSTETRDKAVAELCANFSLSPESLTPSVLFY